MRILAIYVILENGTCIFERKLSVLIPSKNLVAGLLTGFQHFIKEVTGSYPVRLEAGGFVFHIDKRGPVSVVIALKDEEPEIEKILVELGLRFMKNFGDKIESWSSNRNVFKNFNQDIEDIFGEIDVIQRIDPKHPVSAFTLLSIPSHLQSTIKGLMQIKEGDANTLAELIEDTEFKTIQNLEELVEMGHVGRYETDNNIIYFNY